MPRLFLRFTESDGVTESDGDVLDWLVYEGGAILAEGRCAVADLADVTRSHAPWAEDPANVVAFIPATEALALCCRVPGRSVAQLRRALPYAAEEFISEDIETMHVAPGVLSRNEAVRCLVLPRASMESYLSRLAEAGATPGFLTADAMALPVEPNSVAVLYDGEAALVRTSEQAAGVDAPNVAAVLATIHAGWEDAPEPPTLRLVNGALSDIELSQTGFAPSATETANHAGSLLSYLAASFNRTEAINLLQGDYVVKSRAGNAMARWRSVAAWGGVGLVLVVIAQVVEGVWANYQGEKFAAEADALFRDIYGVERAPRNPVAEMQRRLGQAPAATLGFHELLSDLGTALQELASSHQLISLSYSERSGLGAEVILADYDALEALQAAFAGQGGELEVVSAEQFEERVRANLRIAVDA